MCKVSQSLKIFLRDNILVLFHYWLQPGTCVGLLPHIFPLSTIFRQPLLHNFNFYIFSLIYIVYIRYFWLRTNNTIIMNIIIFVYRFCISKAPKSTANLLGFWWFLLVLCAFFFGFGWIFFGFGCIIYCFGWICLLGFMCICFIFRLF